jgi:hypothetical protein
MAVALVQVHKILEDPRAVHNYEFPLALATAAFALASLGAGLISFDHVLFREDRSSAPRKPKAKN